MKKLAFFLLISLVSGSAYAAAPAGDDVTTRPDRYYSTNADALDSLAILPPPPAFDSIEFLIDRARYEQGLIERNTERGELAVLDAKSGKVAESLSKPFGIDITKENTPEIYKLIGNLRGELGDMATRAAKQKYYRTRPYVLYNTKTCYPDDEERLRNNGSYPSGHSARGWAVALILAEINPAKKEAIMQRGFDMGQSRVICGYHWQSDVDAGRLAGSVAVAALHANPKFMEQLDKAKAEFARLVKEGKIK
ncbi:MAG: phosphatase PAP2 family protein [Mailhella sp.]